VAEFEFLPESVDGAADEELLATAAPRTGRWLALGGLAAAAVLIAGLALAGNGSSPHPPTITTAVTLPSGPPVYDTLPRLAFGRSSRLPVFGVAVLGTSTWVLQDDGLHVVRPGRPAVHLHVPGTPQTARLLADPRTRLVWLVTQQRARAYAADTRVVVDVAVPAFSDVAVLGRRVYLAAGAQLVEAGAGERARQVFLAPGPLAAVAADPDRGRLIVAYQSGPSRVFALRPRPDAAARVERSTTIRSINATLGVAGDAIWFAGFSTGDGALMRLNPVTLRPALHFAYEGSLGSGGVLVAEGASSIWVREGLGGSELRCVDARTGAQAQTWQLDGLISSTTGRAVLGTGSGAARMQMGGCPG
jgi:hypothetical protein